MNYLMYKLALLFLKFKLPPKWLVGYHQIADKRREAKGKGEKERYTHLNAEFQRTAKER